MVPEGSGFPGPFLPVLQVTYLVPNFLVRLDATFYTVSREPGLHERDAFR